MKKNLFMVAAVALIATVSCNKEELANNDVQGAASDIAFVAELEQPGDGVEAAAPAAAQTKTALGSTTNDVTAVNWVANDKVSINGVEFTTTSSGAKATFTTTKTFDETATKFDAIYPASAGTALTAVTIPASQKGTFAEAAISVATSTTTSLSFKNVASIIKFRVPAACSNITITSTANLAGTFSVTFGSDGLPVVGTVSSASKTITLSGSFVTGKDYYVAVLPGSHKFTFRLDGYLSKASTKAVATTRARIANLQALPALVECEWGLVGQHQNWSLVKANLTRLYKEADNLFVVKGIKLSDSGFKFTQLTNTNWDLTFGVHSGSYVYSPLGSWYTGIYTNNRGDKSNDIKVSDWSKKYDIYLRYVQNGSWGKELGFAIVETGAACPSF